jgi:hypothetical protein
VDAVPTVDAGVLSRNYYNHMDADVKAHPTDTTVEIGYAPASHRSDHSVNDRRHTLWESWALRRLTGQHVHFGGDTVYRTVLDGENGDMVPRHPAFREIGEKLWVRPRSANPGRHSPAYIPAGPMWFRPASQVGIRHALKCLLLMITHF